MRAFTWLRTQTEMMYARASSRCPKDNSPSCCIAYVSTALQAVETRCGKRLRMSSLGDPYNIEAVKFRSTHLRRHCLIRAA